MNYSYTDFDGIKIPLVINETLDVQEKKSTIEGVENSKETNQDFFEKCDRDKVANILRCKVANAQPERMEILNQVEKEVDRLMSGKLAEKVKMMKPRTSDNLRKQLIREKMTKESEKRGVEKIIVPARVVSVGKNGCVVDLLGIDIPGYVPKYFWSYVHVEDMRTVVKKGDVIDLCVLAYRTNKDDTTLPISEEGVGMYLCSRLQLIDNPWDNLPYKVGDIIRVRCAQLKKHNYFGTIEGLNMQIYCEYPDRGVPLRVIEGEEYECKIYRIDVDSRLMKAKTLLHGTEL